MPISIEEVYIAALKTQMKKWKWGGNTKRAGVNSECTRKRDTRTCHEHNKDISV
jgi:hypothetical protein